MDSGDVFGPYVSLGVLDDELFVPADYQLSAPKLIPTSVVGVHYMGICTVQTGNQRHVLCPVFPYSLN